MLLDKKTLKFFQLILALSILSLQFAVAQSSFSDTVVNKLIQKFKYYEAIENIQSKLPELSNSDYSQNLFYHTKLAFSYFRLMNIDSALHYALEAQKLTSYCSDSTQLIETIRTIAYVYNISGNIDSALFYTNKLLNYAGLHKDTVMKRNALSSLGAILAQNKRYQEALTYHTEAFQLTRKIRDTSNYAIVNYNMGLSHMNLKNSDSCLAYLFQAASNAQKAHNPEILLQIYGTIADCALLTKNDALRKEYLLKANEIAFQIGNPIYIAMGFSNLMQHSYDVDDLEGVILYGKKTNEILKSSPFPFLEIKTDSLIYLANRNLGNYKEALISMENYVVKKEKIINENQEKSLNQLLLKYQTAEKDLIIANQKLDIQQNHKVITNFVVITIILLASLAGITFYWLKRKKFLTEIFKKEKYLDTQYQETRDWLQWHLNNEKQESGNAGIPVQGDNQVHQLNLSLLFIELRESFEKQKLYLNPEINLDSVVKILGTNKRYLYEALSNSSDDNFRNFVNRYRVNEAKQIIEGKIKSDENMIIPDICANTGFNSITSFYRAFNLITGLTPKQYADEFRRELRMRKYEEGNTAH